MMRQGVREALRQGRRVLSSSERGYHSSRPAKMGGYDYEHATHMYNLDRMSNPGLKFGLGIAGGVILGVAVPLIAVQWQQKKAQG
ncbi:hypothetical protein M9434_004506 [Picochlorum sp. BPE23]|jgi:hypothetical protein|nr:hypothetical protein M9435_002597 [Picochlorum sp. BPE23]KAI8110932.1 hypothetical protein M9434_004506 [Picochlorum sp. BPE23]